MWQTQIWVALALQGFGLKDSRDPQERMWENKENPTILFGSTSITCRSFRNLKQSEESPPGVPPEGSKKSRKIWRVFRAENVP